MVQTVMPSSYKKATGGVITLELVADKEEGVSALISAIGRATTTDLQRDGNILLEAIALYTLLYYRI